MQTAAEARQQLLDGVAETARELAFAIASLGAAYEQLDQHYAGRLEDELFQPVQRAYGRARRTHAEFAGRHGLESPELAPPAPGLPSIGAKVFIENAAAAVGKAEAALTELQDSLLPVDVGDPQLRAELAELRELLSGFSKRARELVSTIGR